MDDALIKKFLHGKPQQVSRAISMLYDELAKKFLGHLYKRGISDADAQDIIQDVFLKIADKPKLIAKADQVFPYVWRIFFNAYNEYLRGKQTLSVEDPIEDGNGERVLGTYTNNDLLLETCIGEAMSSLRKRSYDEALVIELSTINGWGLKEVAVFVDKSYGATREYVSQARKKLQELIFKFCGQDVLLDMNLVTE